MYATGLLAGLLCHSFSVNKQTTQPATAEISAIPTSEAVPAGTYHATVQSPVRFGAPRCLLRDTRIFELQDGSSRVLGYRDGETKLRATYFFCVFDGGTIRKCSPFMRGRVTVNGVKARFRQERQQRGPSGAYQYGQ